MAPQHANPEPAEPATLWERIERPAKAPRTTLSHASIAAAAVEMADAEGLEAVSMRKLSGHLGVTTMALYRYVTGKDELFELMLDTAFAARPPAAPAPGWRGAMRAHAERSRTTALRHPWILELTATQVVTLTPNVVAEIDAALGAFTAAGLDADTAMAAVQTVRAYIRGALADEIGQRELMKRQNWSDGDDLRDAYGPRMNWLLNTGRYPAYRDYTKTAHRKDDFAWRYDFGLDCVLDGLAARLGI